MSLQTEFLKLFQYEERDGVKTFSIGTRLNENWKKIYEYLKGVLLSDLNNADEATLQAAVKVQDCVEDAPHIAPYTVRQVYKEFFARK